MEVFLPPGFRFYPTEEELVSFYLPNKLESGSGRDDDLKRQMDLVIPVLDIYDFNPWDLPQFAGELCQKDPEQWFFFVARQESEARGGRPKRLTTNGSGYWKATGSPNEVYSADNRSIGVKRTMVFYKGRAPKGTKTEWKMNEYKAIVHGPAAGTGDQASSSTASASATPRLRQEFSLCRIYKKSKTMRAFDRRPPLLPPLPLPQEAEMAQSATVQPETTQQIISNQNQNPPLLEERESSPDTSSSGGDHGPLSQETTYMQSAMDVDNELLWDWDHFNW